MAGGRPLSTAGAGATTGIVTERLVLRQWREADLEPFARLNADPEVMAQFPAPLSREESDAFARRCRDTITENGHGLWATEVRASGTFIGFVGLAMPTWELPFTPCTEVGWRLAREAWGHGYASEAAAAVLSSAFTRLGLEEVVSFTALTNHRSERVMQRIGMRRDLSGDFDHPALPEGHRLRRHLLYRIGWAEIASDTATDVGVTGLPDPRA